MLNWRRSYLSDRFQYLEISGIKSPKTRVYQVMPQGSILRPLFFILYINNMDLYSNLKIAHYTDDSTAYYFGTDFLYLPTK